ncbi:hypothetical protein PBCV1_A356R [Paramecium bursaria Chlorella virus 1]|uniref:Uncharacterized protein n=1 Tax=Paramecium bursaria Chlorella virus 1 TaxID=10506 RepID=Q84670_PBCV1|nr:hypothetical protein PBCV1_A356R [Paramecium bursaria Chlorella virus 1]AAC96724.1 hypothetical protein [Paramecium bursaria Chlorella virus 1]
MMQLIIYVNMDITKRHQVILIWRWGQPKYDMVVHGNVFILDNYTKSPEKFVPLVRFSLDAFITHLGIFVVCTWVRVNIEPNSSLPKQIPVNSRIQRTPTGVLKLFSI